jgi:outer membrane protein assembly factor BamB
MAMLRNALFSSILLMSCLTTSMLFAGDWPMWRFDAGRGASTPDALPEGMTLRWVRQLEPSQPAWPPTQDKLQFDLVPEPVAAGDLIFVPSNVTDTLTAYETETGNEVWRFYADAPVRFAPVVDAGNVFFVSDDGHLYALDAQTGKLLWSFNGGPADRRILGNSRLVSSWPARGGPVLHENRLYFSASIWPFMGIFIHCVEPETGRVLWTNSGDGTNFIVHPHNAPSFGTVVPQGHFAAMGDSLVVPGGRSTPAVYDARTGELRHFAFDKRIGSHAISVRGNTYFVAGNTYERETGQHLGSGEPVVSDENSLLYVSGDRLASRSVQGKVVLTTKKDRRGEEVTTKSWEQEEHYSSPLEDKPGDLFLRAGKRLYSAGAGQVAAYNLPEAGKPVWTGPLEGTAVTMLAADEKLFVVDESCRLYCFGLGSEKPTRHKLEPLDLSIDESQSDRVQQIAPPNRAEHGYALSLGIGTGALIEEMLTRTDYFVIAVDPDAARVAAFRKKMTAAGLYGRRVSAHRGDPYSFAFPNYIAGLIFSETPDSEKLTEHPQTFPHLFEALRPYGGTMVFALDPEIHQSITNRLAEINLPNAEVERQDQLTKIVRSGALPGSDDWTHQYGDSAQSVVSQDRLVKAPLGLLWYGGPSHAGILPRHGHGPSPQVAGGRLFIEGPEMLRSVDVYTGRLLWEKSLPEVGKFYDNTSHHPGAGEIGSNYVSLQDHLYVVYGDAILELDASSGQETQRFQLQPENGQPAPHWGYLGVSGDYLVATSDPLEVSLKKTEPQPKNSAPSEYLAAIPPGDVWSYLAGSDPPDDWNSPEFDDSKWKTGKAGFGYGDNDDATVLDMKGKYTRVYIRHEFDRSVLKNADRLGLMINYDDAFVAYLNGQEILRRGVKGDGKQAKVSSHEASGHEFIEIEQGIKLLKPGKNLLSIVGHNTGTTSSDFTLDPYLVYTNRNQQPTATKKTPQDNPASNAIASAFEQLAGGQYAAGSRRLVVFNRKTGEKLWHRDALFNFRHNNIAVTNDRLFCIDRLTEERLAALRRRGRVPTGAPVLYSFDLATGTTIWKTEKNVFGTFLNYNETHDTLIQAGSSYRDRAKDEVNTGMIAYRGTDGEALWTKRDFVHGGPCLLWKDLILTNGGGGVALDIKTGEATGWNYSRHYGCNTAVGSEHLLTFRSGAAGFYDLLNDSGTGNLGGFKSSCTSNLIVADGVLNAPDYTRTCSCAYQNQTSLALIHMPEAEFWTFGGTLQKGRTGINLGAPGDRRDERGTLWLDVPSTGGESEKISVKFEPERPKIFRHHASTVHQGELPWVAASGVEGLERMTIDVEPGNNYEVRLLFLEPETASEGDRVFDVILEGKLVLAEFDIVKAAGSSQRSVSHTFQTAVENGQLSIEFRSSTDLPPLLSGVELIAH